MDHEGYQSKGFNDPKGNSELAALREFEITLKAVEGAWRASKGVGSTSESDGRPLLGPSEGCREKKTVPGYQGMYA